MEEKKNGCIKNDEPVVMSFQDKEEESEEEKEEKKGSVSRDIVNYTSSGSHTKSNSDSLTQNNPFFYNSFT